MLKLCTPASTAGMTPEAVQRLRDKLHGMTLAESIADVGASRKALVYTGAAPLRAIVAPPADHSCAAAAQASSRA